MPWSLEIHHIDVNQGDATLIVARQVGLAAGAVPIVRSILVDGGRAAAAADVNNYITLTAGLAAVNAIVVTHYDADHMNGIAAILRTYAGTYDDTLIFDQGWPGAGGYDNDFIYYLRAINGLRTDAGLSPVFAGHEPPRTRITNDIRSYAGGVPMIGGSIPAAGTVSVPAGAPGSINQPSNWLVGREIMWMDHTGNANPALYGGGAAPGAVGGPPLMRCIAANEYVMRPAGTNGYRPSGILNRNSAAAKNARSLAFLVQFESFRYYIGGDISSIQEDNAAAAGPGIGNYLAAQGQIQAMKASHHGSEGSTSAGFIAQINPVAAFISCGFNNNFGANPAVAGQGPWPNGHPQQSVLNDLEAHMALDNYYLTADRGSDDYCRRLKRGIGAWPMGYTVKAVIAGGWGPPNPSAGPAAPSPCGGWWPNDGLPATRFGHIRINVAAGPAVPGAFTVTYSRPAITQPVLTANLTLPANTRWPNGTPLPVNTLLPAGTLWPGAITVAMDGLTVNLAYALTINLPWPWGTVIPADTILPGTDISGFGFPAATLLPANVVWGNGVALPAGTILPAACQIPAGINSPNPAGLDAGETLMAATLLPAGVIWPAGVALPANTSLPAGSSFPPNSTWPAGAPIPAHTVPAGTSLPIGLQLPAGFTFPPGIQWPVATPLPALRLPAGIMWPVGQPLPQNTILPNGSRLPMLIRWPAGVALPGAGAINQVINH